VTKKVGSDRFSRFDVDRNKQTKSADKYKRKKKINQT